MKLYISSGAVVLLLLLYLPLVLWLLRKIWRRLPSWLPVRVATVAVVFTAAAAIPLWDVVLTSRDMAKLCPTAGIFVKRTVNVQGFLTRWGGKGLVKPGFTYVERIDPYGRFTLYRREGDRIETLEYAAGEYQPISKYEFIENEVNGRVVEGAQNINTDRSVVRDRETGEVLGYAVLFRAYPGWVDRQTLARLGQVRWICPEKSGPQALHLLDRVLLPN